MSPKYTLNRQDLAKIAKGAGIATGGAILTYLLSELPNIDFGQYTPLIVALASVLLNALLKFIGDQQPVTVPPLEPRVRIDEIE